MAEWRQEAARAVESELEHARQTGEWSDLGPLRRTGDGTFTADLRGRRIDPIDEVCLAGRDGPRDGPAVPVRAELRNGVLRIRDAGPLPPGCERVWARRLPARDRLGALARALRDLGPAPLADRLAEGRLDPVPDGADPWDTARRACRTPGLHLVWGPPGTGKTRLVAEAAAELATSGKRVLVITGEQRDVGWSGDDAERLAIQRDLTDLAATEADLVELGDALTGYDHAAFLAAGRRIENADRSATLAAEFTDVRRRHDDAAADLTAARDRLRAAREAWDRVATERGRLGEARELGERLAEVDTEIAVRAERIGTAARRYRGRRADRKALRAAQARRDTLQAAIQDCRERAHPLTDDDVTALEADVAAAHESLDAAARAESDAHTRLERLRGRVAQIRSAGLATDQDRRFHAECLRRDLPGLHARREELHREGERRAARRGRLEERLWWLGERARRRQQEDEATAWESARIVTTTLARHVDSTRPFDVVLLDDAGSARLADVLLAVARARETAVVLGDFRQPGPRVRPAALKTAPGVREWLLATPFGHCGIREPADAERHPGCTVLTRQHRYGPTVTALANSTGYHVLEHAGAGETEVLLVDPAGARADHPSLARFAAGQGEIAVLAPNQVRAGAWLAALRDRPDVAVGTARTLPGREFDTVLLDLTEDDWSNRVRSFGSGITRARHRLYLLADLEVVKAAPIGSPLGAVNALRLQGAITVHRLDSLGVPHPRRPQSATDRPVPVTPDGTMSG
ncbi:AAA domain-containing protein [Qaidamihabitans albus]|uniref:AAA domain-containing protein n=1 Tax=Qaidamihabitans albus TaxID=2795733 RepID=UPI0018F21809|nr:AAA domain-containing protein [Qaidamihabitans albus]